MKKYELCTELCPAYNLMAKSDDISPNAGTHILQSIAAIAVRLHKVKQLKNLAVIDCICSHTLQPTLGLLTRVFITMSVLCSTLWISGGIQTVMKFAKTLPVGSLIDFWVEFVHPFGTSQKTYFYHLNENKGFVRGKLMY